MPGEPKAEGCLPSAFWEWTPGANCTILRMLRSLGTSIRISLLSSVVWSVELRTSMSGEPSTMMMSSMLPSSIARSTLRVLPTVSTMSPCWAVEKPSIDASTV